MKHIENSDDSIGTSYPTTTGRSKFVTGSQGEIPVKIALVGDSTIDNGYWVQQDRTYANKTHTVTHQTAIALAKNNSNTQSFHIGTYAVDGATTADLQKHCPLNKVLPQDQDHTDSQVHQLNAVAHWQPDIAVLSVGGNNYREALAGVLRTNLSLFQLLLRVTPEHAKPIITQAFSLVKQQLLKEYKLIIDDLIAQNPQLDRVVLLSQYFPAITDFTPYFIYAGFSHLARAEGQGQAVFSVVEETMNELYRNVLAYVASKNKPVVFIDVSSSLNPLAGNHTHQIEPNEQGSQVMGRLIAEAVESNLAPFDPTAEHNPVSLLRLNSDNQIENEILDQKGIQNFSVKKINEYISENRYRHVGLFFSPSTKLNDRLEYGYKLIMGNQFDTEYTGLFAFGLLDLSLITVLASYLWRVAINENIHLSLRVAAGAVAAPVLLSKMILGLTLMTVLAPPIYGFHQAVTGFNKGTNDFDERMSVALA